MNIGKPLAVLAILIAALFAVYNAAGYALIACFLALAGLGFVYATAKPTRRK